MPDNTDVWKKAVRDTLALLHQAVQEFARLEPMPVRNAEGRYEFPVCSHRVMEVAKAVRLVSACNAAFALLGMGMTAEAMVMIRLITDYCRELEFIITSQKEAELSAQYRQFMADHFRAPPLTPTEYREERQRRKQNKSGGYLERRHVNQAQRDLISLVPDVDVESFMDSRRSLDSALNSYVHASHWTALELYNPAAHIFDVLGTSNQRLIQASTDFAVNNLLDPIVVFTLMAAERGMNDLVERLNGQHKVLQALPDL